MIKIGDFGFATTLAEAKQQNYYSIGSPSYMSPEVLHRNDYSFASDIWSIGVTYYELATGKLPWKGE
jgi:serine/threonine protein kinase